MKKKQNSWHQLETNQCPKCKAKLMRDLFGKGLIGCSCGFNIEEPVKDILLDRDNETQYVESELQDH